MIIYIYINTFFYFFEVILLRLLNIQKILSITLIVLFAFSPITPLFTTSFADGSDTVTVAFIPDGNFYDIDDNGNMSGYNYDYLMKISQFTNWSFDFVIIDEPSLDKSYDVALQMLVDGDIDLLGSQSLSALESNSNIAFGQNHYGVVRTTISTLSNNYKITSNNYFLLDSIKAGLVSSDENSNQLFFDVMQKYDIEPIITYVNSSDEALKLLVAEEIDVMMNTDFSVYNNSLTTLYSDNPIPIYFAASSSNTDILDELDSAIASVEVTSSAIIQQLQDKYFGMEHTSDLIRTNAENLALENIPYLNIALVVDREPYQFYDDKSSIFVPNGISTEVLDLISQIIDVEFRYNWFDDYQSVIDAIANEEIDVFATIQTDYSMSNTLGVTMSDPYISNNSVLVRRNDNTNWTPTAYYAYVSDYIPFYPYEDLLPVDDFDKVLNDISENGNAILFTDPYLAQYYLQTLSLHNLEIQSVTNVFSNFSMGVANHIDPVILGLLNHAILHLDDYAIDEIIYRNTIVNNEFTFEDFLATYSVSIITALILVFTVIFLVLFYYTNRFRDLSRKDSLTKLYNAGYFHSYAEEKTPKLDCGCLILIDIDNFKQINDTHGHHVGDDIIKSVSNTLCNRFRQDDVVARLGGDEFIVLLEYKPSIEDLQKRAQLILDDLSNDDCEVPITLSIGGLVFSNGMFYDNIYRLADDVLYSVKENGRNGFAFREFST